MIKALEDYKPFAQLICDEINVVNFQRGLCGLYLGDYYLGDVYANYKSKKWSESGQTELTFIIK